MDAPHPSTRLVLVIFAVDDAARAAAFYRAAFGWEVRVDLPVFVQLRISDELGLALYERRAFAGNTGRLPGGAVPGGTTATELYLLCDDVEAAAAALRAAGAEELSALAPRVWGDEVAYFRDLDGNVVAVARSREDD